MNLKKMRMIKCWTPKMISVFIWSKSLAIECYLFIIYQSVGSENREMLIRKYSYWVKIGILLVISYVFFGQLLKLQPRRVLRQILYQHSLGYPHVPAVLSFYKRFFCKFIWIPKAINGSSIKVSSNLIFNLFYLFKQSI